MSRANRRLLRYIFSTIILVKLLEQLKCLTYITDLTELINSGIAVQWNIMQEVKRMVTKSILTWKTLMT